MYLATPSLAAFASNILFKFLFNLDLFQLRRDTAYGLYVYAVASNRFPPSHLLPPSFPFIRIVYGSDLPRLRRHYHCPGGNGWWHRTDSITLASLALAIADLVRFKDTLWCEFFRNHSSFPSLYVIRARIVVNSSSCVFFITEQWYRCQYITLRWILYIYFIQG